MKQCCSSKKYSKEYDAYYCEFCNVWLETMCSDSECKFCIDRPKYPKLVNIEPTKKE